MLPTMNSANESSGLVKDQAAVPGAEASSVAGRSLLQRFIGSVLRHHLGVIIVYFIPIVWYKYMYHYVNDCEQLDCDDWGGLEEKFGERYTYGELSFMCTVWNAQKTQEHWMRSIGMLFTTWEQPCIQQLFGWSFAVSTCFSMVFLGICVILTVIQALINVFSKCKIMSLGLFQMYYRDHVVPKVEGFIPEARFQASSGSVKQKKAPNSIPVFIYNNTSPECSKLAGHCTCVSFKGKNKDQAWYIAIPFHVLNIALEHKEPLVVFTNKNVQKALTALLSEYENICCSEANDHGVDVVVYKLTQSQMAVLCTEHNISFLPYTPARTGAMNFVAVISPYYGGVIDYKTALDQKRGSITYAQPSPPLKNPWWYLHTCNTGPSDSGSPVLDQLGTACVGIHIGHQVYNKCESTNIFVDFVLLMQHLEHVTDLGYEAVPEEVPGWVKAQFNDPVASLLVAETNYDDGGKSHKYAYREQQDTNVTQVTWKKKELNVAHLGRALVVRKPVAKRELTSEEKHSDFWDSFFWSPLTTRGLDDPQYPAKLAKTVYDFWFLDYELPEQLTGASADKKSEHLRNYLRTQFMNLAAFIYGRENSPQRARDPQDRLGSENWQLTLFTMVRNFDLDAFKKELKIAVFGDSDEDIDPFEWEQRLTFTWDPKTQKETSRLAMPPKYYLGSAVKAASKLQTVYESSYEPRVEPQTRPQNPDTIQKPVLLSSVPVKARWATRSEWKKDTPQSAPSEFVPSMQNANVDTLLSTMSVPPRGPIAEKRSLQVHIDKVRPANQHKYSAQMVFDFIKWSGVDRIHAYSPGFFFNTDINSLTVRSEVSSYWLGCIIPEILSQCGDSSPGIPWASQFNARSNSQLFDSGVSGRLIIWEFVWRRILLLADIGSTVQFDQGLPVFHRIAKENMISHVNNGACDPIRVFVKNEPHSNKKIEEGRYRLISSVSVIDQSIQKLLHSGLNQSEMDCHFRLPFQGGIGHTDLDTERLATIFAANSCLGTPWSSDVSSFDWCVRPEHFSVDWCYRANRVWSDGSYLKQRETLWFKVSLGFELLLTNALFVTGDGAIHHPPHGIQKSGSYNTTSTNSHIRAFIGYASGALASWTMGDDAVEWFPRGMNKREIHAKLSSHGFNIKEDELVDESSGKTLSFIGHRYDFTNNPPILLLSKFEKSVVAYYYEQKSKTPAQFDAHKKKWLLSVEGEHGNLRHLSRARKAGMIDENEHNRLVLMRDFIKAGVGSARN